MHNENNQRKNKGNVVPINKQLRQWQGRYGELNQKYQAVVKELEAFKKSRSRLYGLICIFAISVAILIAVIARGLI